MYFVASDLNDEWRQRASSATPASDIDVRSGEGDAESEFYKLCLFVNLL